MIHIFPIIESVNPNPKLTDCFLVMASTEQSCEVVLRNVYEKHKNVLKEYKSVEEFVIAFAGASALPTPPPKPIKAKKIQNSYMRFVRDHRDQVKEDLKLLEHGRVSMAEVSRRLGQMWKNIDYATKAKYIKEYDDEKNPPKAIIIKQISPNRYVYKDVAGNILYAYEDDTEGDGYLSLDSLSHIYKKNSNDSHSKLEIVMEESLE